MLLLFQIKIIEENTFINESVGSIQFKVSDLTNRQLGTDFVERKTFYLDLNPSIEKREKDALEEYREEIKEQMVEAKQLDEGLLDQLVLRKKR